MSLAITHFAIGITIVMLYSILRDREIHTSTILVGGLWALLPDAHHITTGPIADFFWYLHQTGWANLFFLHGTLDTADPGDSLLVSVVVLLTMMVVANHMEKTDTIRRSRQRRY